MTISARLFAFAVLSLLPALAVLAVLVVELDRSRMNEVHDLASRQTQQANSEMTRLTEGVRSLLTAVASASEVQAFDAPTCDAYLARLHRRLPQLNAIGVLDAAGNVRCWHNDTPPRTNYADRDYFRQAIATGDFVIGSYIEARSTPSLAVLPFALPIRSDAGAVIGVAAASIRLETLQAIVSSWPVPPGGSLTLADRDGVILARSPLPERFVGSRIPEPFVTWVRGNAPGVEIVRSQDGTERVLAYIPAGVTPSGIYISSGIATAQALEALSIDWRWIVGVFVAGLVGTVLSSLVAARYLLRRPVAQLIAVADAWAEGNPARAHRPIATAEFEQVARALDRMGHRIEERSAVLIGELNHRVKNTLALVQAIGSQTASRTRDPIAFSERFAERLRALARTHDLLTARHFEAVRLTDLVGSEIEAVGARERTTLDGPEVAIPPEFAVTLNLIVHELATNAVKHGCFAQEDGRLEIHWRLEPGQVAAEDLVLEWIERCPAPIAAFGTAGFGSRLIDRSVSSIGSGGLHYTPAGIRFTLRLPMQAIARATRAA